MVQSEWGESQWEDLVRQVRKGNCTPFLGAGASASVLPTGDGLAQGLIDRWGYPPGLPASLQEVAQHACLMAQDPVTVKEHVAETMSEANRPDFKDPAEPHALLAGHPISVYLTTNYDDHMFTALRSRGKDPVAAVCPWYGPPADRDARTHLDGRYQPVPERPLVYHLHGSLDPPRSLVLAEQDYVEFLVSLGRDIGQDDRRVVPVHIVEALTCQPLLFIGYSLRDWTFRMLYHGFVAAEPDVTKRRHISVQLEPEVGAENLPQVKRYLNRYFDRLSISVFWGDAKAFCTELSQRLAA